MLPRSSGALKKAKRNVDVASMEKNATSSSTAAQQVLSLLESAGGEQAGEQLVVECRERVDDGCESTLSGFNEEESIDDDEHALPLSFFLLSFSTSTSTFSSLSKTRSLSRPELASALLGAMLGRRGKANASSKDNSIFSPEESEEGASSSTAVTAPLLWLLHASRLLPLDDACLESPSAVAFAVAEEARFLIGRRRKEKPGRGGGDDFFDLTSFLSSTSSSSSLSTSPRFFTSIASYLIAAAYASASGPAGPRRAAAAQRVLAELEAGNGEGRKEIIGDDDDVDDYDGALVPFSRKNSLLVTVAVASAALKETVPRSAARAFAMEKLRELLSGERSGGKAAAGGEGGGRGNKIDDDDDENGSKKKRQRASPPPAAAVSFSPLFEDRDAAAAALVRLLVQASSSSTTTPALLPSERGSLIRAALSRGMAQAACELACCASSSSSRPHPNQKPQRTPQPASTAVFAATAAALAAAAAELPSTSSSSLSSSDDLPSIVSASAQALACCPGLTGKALRDWSRVVTVSLCGYGGVGVGDEGESGSKTVLVSSARRLLARAAVVVSSPLSPSSPPRFDSTGGRTVIDLRAVLSRAPPDVAAAALALERTAVAAGAGAAQNAEASSRALSAAVTALTQAAAEACRSVSASSTTLNSCADLVVVSTIRAWLERSRGALSSSAAASAAWLSSAAAGAPPTGSSSYDESTGRFLSLPPRPPRDASWLVAAVKGALESGEALRSACLRSARSCLLGDVFFPSSSSSSAAAADGSSGSGSTTIMPPPPSRQQQNRNHNSYPHQRQLMIAGAGAWCAVAGALLPRFLPSLMGSLPERRQRWRQRKSSASDVLRRQQEQRNETNSSSLHHGVAVTVAAAASLASSAAVLSTMTAVVSMSALPPPPPTATAPRSNSSSSSSSLELKLPRRVVDILSWAAAGRGGGTRGMADVADAARRGLPWRCVEEEEEEQDSDDAVALPKNKSSSSLRRRGGVHDASLWELEAGAALCGRDESSSGAVGRSPSTLPRGGGGPGGEGVGSEQRESPSWVTSSTTPSPSSRQQQHDEDNNNNSDGLLISQLSSQRPNEELLPPLRAGALEGARAREILLEVVVGRHSRRTKKEKTGEEERFSSASFLAPDETEGARVVQALEGLLEAASAVSSSGVGGGCGGNSKKAASAGALAVAAAAAAAERHFDALAGWVGQEQRRHDRQRARSLQQRQHQEQQQRWRRVRAVVAAVLLLASSSSSSSA